MSSRKLEKVGAAVKQLVDDRKTAGAITMVARKGRIVHFEARGMRDADEKQALKTDAIMRFYSMTKPITTVAAMMLYEEGKLKLDDPVEKYIPALKGQEVYHPDAPVKPDRKITVRDLMRHTSGFTYGFFGDTPVDLLYRQRNILASRDLEAMMLQLRTLPLMHQPGAAWTYGVSTDVLGRVVETVSRKRLDAFIEQRILKPLDMKDTAFHVSRKNVGRFSSCHGPGLKVSDKYSRSRFLRPPTLLSGGGGLVSTARDYMRFCQMLINRGELFGVRLLKPETVEMMTRNQLPRGVRCWGIDGFGFGLGFQVQLKDWGPKGHVGEYGWSGVASTHFWISPEDDLVVLALSQRMPLSMQLQDAVKPLVYQAIVKR
ncbi:MAG: serine hydrolase domain-containing protein [Planctomycetota bacterium]